jgi:hypothetical protein
VLVVFGWLVLAYLAVGAVMVLHWWQVELDNEWFVRFIGELTPWQLGGLVVGYLWDRMWVWPWLLRTGGHQ